MQTWGTYGVILRDPVSNQHTECKLALSDVIFSVPIQLRVFTPGLEPKLIARGEMDATITKVGSTRIRVFQTFLAL